MTMSARALSEQEKRDLQFTTHGLVFLIDDTETQNNKKTFFTTYQAISLIKEETIPFVITSSLFKNVIQYQPNIFKPNKWISRKIDDYFYLLVPNKYLNNFPETITTQSNYSERELLIGLKIDHLSNISDTDILNPEFHKNFPKSKNKYLATSELFQKTFLKTDKSPLFITNHEYYQANASKYIPRWAFCLFGHGYQSVSIDQQLAILNVDLKNLPAAKKAISKQIKEREEEKQKGKIIYREGALIGLERPDFKKLLDFFNTKITTQFVFFNTCYGASTNLQKVLTASNSTVLKNYSFVLISGASHASSVTTDAPNYHSFEIFFKNLSGTVPINYEKTLRYIYEFYDEQSRGKSPIGQIPTIKLPGYDWLQVLEVPNKIVTLGNILAKTRTNPLNVSHYFKKTKDPLYPDIILVYPTNIPFPLKLTAKNNFTKPPLFISMQPGDSIHIFNKIDASDFTLTQIIDSFLSLADLQEDKIFIIEELIVKNKLQILDNNENNIFKKVIFINKKGEIQHGKTERLVSLLLKNNRSYERYFASLSQAKKLDFKKDSNNEIINFAKQLRAKINKEKKKDMLQNNYDFQKLNQVIQKKHISFLLQEKQLKSLKNFAQALNQIAQKSIQPLDVR